MIDGIATELAAAEITDQLGDAFAAKAGFDPRLLATPYSLLPHSAVAHPGLARRKRTRRGELMRGGHWVVSD